MRAPIVEEVRKYPTKHTQEFQGNLSAICADLKHVQKASGHKIVRLAPRKLERPRKHVKAGNQ